MGFSGVAYKAESPRNIYHLNGVGPKLPFEKRQNGAGVEATKARALQNFDLGHFAVS